MDGIEPLKIEQKKCSSINEIIYELTRMMKQADGADEESGRQGLKKFGKPRETLIQVAESKIDALSRFGWVRRDEDPGA